MWIILMYMNRYMNYLWPLPEKLKQLYWKEFICIKMLTEIGFYNPLFLYRQSPFSIVLICTYFNYHRLVKYQSPTIEFRFQLPGYIAMISHFSHVRLCDPIDGSPTGSTIPGILQARILEWVAISFSNAWKRKVKVKSLSRIWLLKWPYRLQPTRLLCPWIFQARVLEWGAIAFSARIY